MLIAILQVLATILAGAGLWLWWRRLPQQHGIRTIVGLGLVARATAGFVLFWISYLRLPIAPALQLGGGFWFFGQDGIAYFGSAVNAARRGVWAVAGLDPILSSVFFRKILGLLTLLFGATPSVALLLNLFSYLALCALLIKLSQRLRARPSAIVFALTAASFSPSWILWALQPMKEPLFILLIVGFLYAFAVWVDGVTAARPSIAVCLSAAVWMTALIYAMAGVRWYFTFILLGASTIVMPLVVHQATARRLTIAASGVLLLAVLAEVIPFGADPYTPTWARVIIRPLANQIQSKSRGLNVIETMDRARENLYRYNAATDIAIVKRNQIVPALEAAGASDARAGSVPASQAALEAVRPTSAADRIFAGTVALLVPRWLATRFRWIEVGGGRGLLALADLDTILFDATLCAALLLTWRQSRNGGVRHVLFWHVCLTALLIAGPLVYTALNLGTLLRQRAMIYTCFVLLPLTIGQPSPRDDTGVR